MMEVKKLLVLFSGSRSVEKEAEKLGFECFSIDINNFEGTNLVIDIEFLEKKMIPWIPDVIWISVPCTTYSIAAISHHRHVGGQPKTEFAKKSDNLVLKSFEVVSWFPNAKWFLENPRGYLRKMQFMLGIPKTTVWYCKYGDIRAKPTDIWSNWIYSILCPEGWIPRPVCKNGNNKCHHEKAPRGSRKGTQGLKDNYLRSKIPPMLCKEILESCLKKSYIAVKS